MNLAKVNVLAPAGNVLIAQELYNLEQLL